MYKIFLQSLNGRHYSNSLMKPLACDQRPFWKDKIQMILQCSTSSKVSYIIWFNHGLVSECKSRMPHTSHSSLNICACRVLMSYFTLLICALNDHLYVQYHSDARYNERVFCVCVQTHLSPCATMFASACERVRLSSSIYFSMGQRECSNVFAWMRKHVCLRAQMRLLESANEFDCTHKCVSLNACMQTSQSWYLKWYTMYSACANMIWLSPWERNAVVFINIYKTHLRS